MKTSGGTRNYSNKPATLAKRKEEFDDLMSSGYDISRSLFDASGGFVATHEQHERIKKNDRNIDKSDVAAELLAKKGYKVYLDSELAMIEGIKNPDGRVYDYRMDIKTINEANDNTIRGAVERGIKQLRNYENTRGLKGMKKAIVLYQNTPDMDKNYVISQFDKFVERSSKEFRNSVDLVIVVGSNGHVHRHFLDK